MIMPPEKMTHSVLHSTGQIHALLLFAQVLAKRYPDVVAEAEGLWQYGLVSLEKLPDAGDVVIEGYQFAVEALRKAASGAQKTL